MSILNKVLSVFVGNKAEKDLKDAVPYVDVVNGEYDKLQNISNDELRQITIDLKEEVGNSAMAIEEEITKLKDGIEKDEVPINEREVVYEQIDKLKEKIKVAIGEKLDDILPRAFAVVKETAKRFKENEEIEVTATDLDRDMAATRDSIDIVGDKAIYKNRWIAGGNEIIWDMVHYDVQIIGGVALHQGKIAEMSTGEGKTLVATLPVFLNALSGKGVHMVTVNDYLAKRDSEWMGTLYEFHGLTVDCIDRYQPHSPERRKAYLADITFGTNNEYGFDYLRDNMSFNPDELVQREHYYAIVDEVDSVLIDDARTPLIISGPVPRGDDQLFDDYRQKVQSLYTAQRQLVTDILIQAKKLITDGNEEDGGKLLLRAHKGLPKNKAIIKYLSESGMKALMLKTENLFMQNNNKDMHKITDDLFFVIEEKQNSVDLTEKGIDLITGASDDPNFFVLPDIGSEVAEIEKSEKTAEEKLKVKDAMLGDYAIKSERVHTVNQLLKAYAMFEKDVEYVLMDNKVKIVDEQTGRIMEGRRYSDGLHQAIEAKENVKVEAATQTMATITLQNFFRMYHKLAGMTGTAETEAGELWDIYKLDVMVIPTNRPIVRDDREDLVFKTVREKYNAVAEEVVELVKAERPVLVGTTSVEVSELLSRMLKMRGVKHNVLNAKLHQREADVVAEAGKDGAVTIATNMAGRGTDIKLSDKVKAAGGLAIIGTERHESRRVDRQLRGRAGRQGDPGSSQFYVSLEDNLMRLFGSDRISKMMDRLGIKEGEVIQHSMITKSIERAQKKVEENNFGIRKRLLEYDDVMNSQREVIYSKRKNALYGERLGVDISNMMYEVVESIVYTYHGNADFDEFKFELIRLLSVDCQITEDDYLKLSSEDIVDRVYANVLDVYQRKVEGIRQQAFPVMKNVYETSSHIYENIVVPITDGPRTFSIVTNLKKAHDTEGRELVKSFQKSILLHTIDESWKENLRELDELKQSVQNASYEQKDPLLIYKFESFELFKGMMEKVSKEVGSVLMKARIPEEQQVRDAGEAPNTDHSKYQTSRTDAIAQQGDQDKSEKAEPVRVERKVGRNEPCPCGSGKKYKQCHGK